MFWIVVFFFPGALSCVCSKSSHGHHDVGHQLCSGDGLWLHRDACPTCILFPSSKSHWELNSTLFYYLNIKEECKSPVSPWHNSQNKDSIFVNITKSSMTQLLWTHLPQCYFLHSEKKTQFWCILRLLLPNVWGIFMKNIL